MKIHEPLLVTTRHKKRATRPRRIGTDLPKSLVGRLDSFRGEFPEKSQNQILREALELYLDVYVGAGP